MVHTSKAARRKVARNETFQRAPLEQLKRIGEELRRQKAALGRGPAASSGSHGVVCRLLLEDTMAREKAIDRTREGATGRRVV